MEKQAYTVAEVAARTAFSRQTVTLLFQNEPGVIVKAAQTRNKRRYRSLRIPHAVYLRVLGRLSK